MKRTMLVMVMAFALLLSTMGAALAGPPRGAPADLHCDAHQTEVKVDVPQGWDFDADGPYVEIVTVTDTRTGEDIDVRVTVDGGTVTFALVNSDLELESASFCLKGGTNQTGPQTGTSGNTDGIPNRGGQAPDVSYVVLYSVTTVDPGNGNGDGVWCSPGFWKNQLGAWGPTGISPHDLWMDSGFTYLEVLDGALHPPGANAELVADALSAAHPDVNYLGERVENSCPLDADVSQ